jgi:hypothetical protein
MNEFVFEPESLVLVRACRCGAGIATVRGGQWQSPQVMRLLDRLGLVIDRGQ